MTVSVVVALRLGNLICCDDLLGIHLKNMLVRPYTLKWVSFRSTNIQQSVLGNNTSKLIVMGDHRVSESCDCTWLFVTLVSSDMIVLNLIILNLRTCLHDLLTVDARVRRDIWLLEFVFKSYHRWQALFSICGRVHICSHWFGSVIDLGRWHKFHIIAFRTIINIVVGLKLMRMCSTSPMFIDLYVGCLISWLNRPRSLTVSELEVTFCHALLLHFLEFNHAPRSRVLCKFCFMDWLWDASFMTQFKVARVDVDTRLGLLRQSIVGSLINASLINCNLLWLGRVVVLCAVMSEFDTVLVRFSQIRLIFN